MIKKNDNASQDEDNALFAPNSYRTPLRQTKNQNEITNSKISPNSVPTVNTPSGESPTRIQTKN